MPSGPGVPDPEWLPLRITETGAPVQTVMSGSSSALTEILEILVSGAPERT